MSGEPRHFFLVSASMTLFMILLYTAWEFIFFSSLDTEYFGNEVAALEETLEKMCTLSPEDTEREQIMSLSFLEKETLAVTYPNSSLLSAKEWQTLSKLPEIGSKQTVCKDNHKQFNQTVYSELNLLFVKESPLGPELVRNLTSFTLLQLDIQKVGCNYTLIKSDSDSNVDDSKVDIPLVEEAIKLESPYNSIGVTCSAALEDLQHFLDPTMTNIYQNVSEETKVVFYFDVFMFIPKLNASTIDCGGHRTDSCHLCSTNIDGCNGQCIWKDGQCSDIEDRRAEGPAYSVLILSFDSTSRSSFSRNLPRSLKYLKQQGGITLKKHHRQGENTYPNQVALFTGAFPINNKGRMDFITEKNNLSWAWEAWRYSGLPTMFHEDMPQFGIFNAYGRKGWGNKRPFTFYHRSAYHAMDSKAYNIRNGALSYGYQCMGNSPSYQRQLSLLSMMARTYSDIPYFAMMHLSEYTHDTIHLARLMDKTVLETLQKLIEGRFTKKTLVIVMGDHGRRYGIPGKGGWLDGNTPMSLLLMPKAMKEEYPQLTNNVRLNSWKVTTMQDIHKTITDPIITKSKHRAELGGHSLFHPIPVRTCEEAFIKEAYCTCPKQKKIHNMTDPTLIEHSKRIVESINQMIKNHSKCQQLQLHHVDWAWTDGDDYHIQLFAQTQSGDHHQGFFTFRAVFSEGQTQNVERMDLYAKTSTCIQSTDPPFQKIRPFCICKALKYFFF